MIAGLDLPLVTNYHKYFRASLLPFLYTISVLCPHLINILPFSCS